MHHEAPSPVTEDDASTATATDTGSAGPGRRRVMMLGAAAGLGVAGAAALAGCGSDSTTGGTSSGGSATAQASATPGTPLAKLADVPVGGVYAAAGTDGRPIVLAQPQAGQVVAFDAACTHAGCKVVAKGTTLDCPCHNSTFDAFTGKNLSGPAPTPLPAVAVKISGTEIVTA